jgi:hypothetical protein
MSEGQKPTYDDFKAPDDLIFDISHRVSNDRSRPKSRHASQRILKPQPNRTAQHSTAQQQKANKTAL